VNQFVGLILWSIQNLSHMEFVTGVKKTHLLRLHYE